MNTQIKDGWQYIIKRIEWHVVAIQVDEYERQTIELYRCKFSEKEIAIEHMDSITIWGGWQNSTRYWKDAPKAIQSYTKVFVEYREENINNIDFILP